MSAPSWRRSEEGTGVAEPAWNLQRGHRKPPRGTSDLRGRLHPSLAFRDLIPPSSAMRARYPADGAEGGTRTLRGRGQAPRRKLIQTGLEDGVSGAGRARVGTLRTETPVLRGLDHVVLRAHGLGKKIV